MKSRGILSVAPLAGALLAAVCGGGCGDSGLAPARGAVHVDGQPLIQGRVVFRPVAGGSTAIGAIQSNGEFEMRVAKTRGAQIGENHVLIVDGRTAGVGDTASFRAPPQARVTVQAGRDNEFLIQVSRQSGWEQISD